MPPKLEKSPSMTQKRKPSIREVFSPDAHERSHLYSLSWISAYTALYVSSLGVAVLSDMKWLLPAILANGFAIGGLFLIGHDAAHGTLFRGRRLNSYVARATLLPSLTPLAHWKHAHNLRHHGFTNLRPNDYGWAPKSLQEYRLMPASRRALERFYRTVPGMSLYWIIEIWWKHLIRLHPEDARALSKYKLASLERTLVFSFAVAIALVSVAALWATVGWTQHPLECTVRLASATILPHIFWCWLMGTVIFLHHTHPCIVWWNDRDRWRREASQARTSVHVQLPRLIDLMLLDIFSHTAHHVDPGISSERLAAEQKILEEVGPEKVLVEKLTFEYFFKVVRGCKLYDFAAQQWIGYSGKASFPELTEQCSAKSGNSGCVVNCRRQA